MKLYTVRGDDGEAIGVFYARYPIDLCEVMDRFCDSVPTERCIYKEAAHGTAFFVSPKQRDDVDPDTGPLLFHAATVNTVAAATNSRSHVNLNCANPTLWQVAGAGHWRTNSASAGLCRRQIIS